jgi:Ser-tRNA(Ala) deacylase AlaX
MQQTELVYLSEMSLLTLEAEVVRVDPGERLSIVLERTVFYPQGGGQPSDTGRLDGAGGSFLVEDVRWLDGEVRHFGSNERGALRAGERVRLAVDRERRELNTRLHSAGHVVDMAVHRLGLGWIPSKGYHFPQGPYVEYAGRLDRDREELARLLDTETGALVEADFATEMRFVEVHELPAYCRFIPENLPAEKPVRVVLYHDFGVACGGTHVSSLGEIGSIRVRKIKGKGDQVRVSYAIDPSQ